MIDNEYFDDFDTSITTEDYYGDEDYFMDQYYEPDDFETYNQNEADDYRLEIYEALDPEFYEEY